MVIDLQAPRPSKTARRGLGSPCRRPRWRLVLIRSATAALAFCGLQREHEILLRVPLPLVSRHGFKHRARVVPRRRLRRRANSAGSSPAAGPRTRRGTAAPPRLAHRPPPWDGPEAAPVSPAQVHLRLPGRVVRLLAFERPEIQVFLVVRQVSPRPESVAPAGRAQSPVPVDMPALDG